MECVLGPLHCMELAVRAWEGANGQGWHVGRRWHRLLDTHPGGYWPAIDGEHCTIISIISSHLENIVTHDPDLTFRGKNWVSANEPNYIRGTRWCCQGSGILKINSSFQEC